MVIESEQVAHEDLVGGGDTDLHTHKLSACTVPNGDVDFNQQQATAFVVENRTSDPSSPVDGQIWLRTDL